MGDAWPISCLHSQSKRGLAGAEQSSGDLQLTLILCIAHSSSCALCLDVPTGASKPGGPESLMGHGAPCQEQHGHPRHAQGCTAAVWGVGQLLLHSCCPARRPHLHTVSEACAAIWALPICAAKTGPCPATLCVGSVGWLCAARAGLHRGGQVPQPAAALPGCPACS